jgi:hypothetical protein
MYETTLVYAHLKDMIAEKILGCTVCKDRGVNQVLHLDYVHMDEYDGYDYVLVVVDALTRFCRVFPCKKTITGEETIQLLLDQWFGVYGKPCEIHSDNDVRFKQWYVGVLALLEVKCSFSPPYHPQANGLCERTNGRFLQCMRSLLLGQKSNNWVRMVGIATAIMNQQHCVATGFSPVELFFCRPPAMLNPNIPDDEDVALQDWSRKLRADEDRVKRQLIVGRSKRMARANKGRTEAKHGAGDYVLVHRERFPARKKDKLKSQWHGPFRVVEVSTGKVRVRASPRLGGEVWVANGHIKRFPNVEEGWEEDDTISDEMDVEEEDAAAKEEEIMEEEVDLVDGKTRTGSYVVEKILKHHYKFGWEFLTMWAGWTLADATWEPPRSFVVDGRINTLLKEYCRDNGMEDWLVKFEQRVLRQAMVAVDRDDDEKNAKARVHAADARLDRARLRLERFTSEC